MNDEMSMGTAHILAIALIILAALIGAWDVIQVSKKHPEYTVSNVLQGWSKDYPILPLTLGVILGHIFWK